MVELDPSADPAASRGAPVRRPLLGPALAMMAGIAMARVVVAPAWVWAIVAGVAVALLVVTVRSRQGVPRGSALVALLVVAAALGAAWFATRTQIAPRSIAHLLDDQPRLATVEGTLLATPRQSKRPDNPLLVRRDDNQSRSRMTIEISAVAVDRERRSAAGRLVITVRESLPLGDDGRPDAPLTGERLTVTGLLMRHPAPLNPGQVDLRDIYAARGVHASMVTDHWAAVVRRPAPWWSPHGWMGRLRHAVRGAMPPPETATGRLLPALFLGDRAELPDAEEMAFVRAGIMHYLAVSGLHVALLSAVMLAVLRVALVPPRARAVVLMVLVVVYALATELRPSVLRAGTFFALLSLGMMLGRRRDLLNTLAAAAIVVLVVHPADLFSAGFQLSFIVALGLITTATRMRQRLFGRHDWTRLADLGPWHRAAWAVRRWLETAIATAVTAWLFAAPLAAWHYHMVAPVGIVATVVAFPLVWMLITGGAVAMILATLHGIGVDWLLALLEYPARALEWLVSLCEAVPYGHLYVARFDWPWALVAIALLVGWSFRRQLRLGRLRLGAAIAVAVVAYVAVGIPRGPADGVRVTALAIGSGNTVLVQAPGGYDVLVDCGSNLLAERTADYATVPALRHLGVGRLDAVVLTHADADHVKDLPPVLEQVGADRVYVSRHFLTPEKSYDDRAVAYLAEHGYDVQPLSEGDTLPAPPGVELRVLAPPRVMPPEAPTNATSVVLRVACKGRAMLLTGDLTPSRLRHLAARDDVAADAILLPHHGERSAELLELLRVSGAHVAVMSVGRHRDAQRSPYTWPKGLAVWKTWRDGAVTVELGPRGAWVEAFAAPRTAAPAGGQASDSD